MPKNILIVLDLSPEINIAENVNIINNQGKIFLCLYFVNKNPKIININADKYAPTIGSSLKNLLFCFHVVDQYHPTQICFDQEKLYV